MAFAPPHLLIFLSTCVDVFEQQVYTLHGAFLLCLCPFLASIHLYSFYHVVVFGGLPFFTSLLFRF